jgi:hypothetical protein
MVTINEIDNLRYQIYSLTTNGELDKPITKPILTRERANKYFSDCIQCAIVSIDEYGSIVEILEKNTTPLKIINKRPKIKKRQRR